jgi:hypothetical protein
MRKALGALGLVILFAATAAAQPPVTRVLTNEGSVLNGAITGGSVTLRTAFGGDVNIDPRRIQALSGTALTLDDGSVVHGRLTGGAMQFASVFGTLAIPVERVTEIQNLRGRAAAAATPPAPPTPTAPPPPPPAPAPPPPVAVAAPPAPAKPATAAVQIVNETRRNLSICVNDEVPCLTIGPNGTATKTLAVGPMRMRVESTTQLGFVVLATGNFEKSVAVDRDTTVRVTESDFR